jgi:hypothetical protein
MGAYFGIVGLEWVFVPSLEGPDFPFYVLFVGMCSVLGTGLLVYLFRGTTLRLVVFVGIPLILVLTALWLWLSGASTADHRFLLGTMFIAGGLVISSIPPSEYWRKDPILVDGQPFRSRRRPF